MVPTKSGPCEGTLSCAGSTKSRATAFAADTGQWKNLLCPLPCRARQGGPSLQQYRRMCHNSHGTNNLRHATSKLRPERFARTGKRVTPQTQCHQAQQKHATHSDKQRRGRHPKLQQSATEQRTMHKGSACPTEGAAQRTARAEDCRDKMGWACF